MMKKYDQKCLRGKCHVRRLDLFDLSTKIPEIGIFYFSFSMVHRERETGDVSHASPCGVVGEDKGIGGARGVGVGWATTGAAGGGVGARGGDRPLGRTHFVGTFLRGLRQEGFWGGSKP